MKNGIPSIGKRDFKMDQEEWLLGFFFHGIHQGISESMDETSSSDPHKKHGRVPPMRMDDQFRFDDHVLDLEKFIFGSCNHLGWL
jgi:hypothetical protein